MFGAKSIRSYAPAVHLYNIWGEGVNAGLMRPQIVRIRAQSVDIEVSRASREIRYRAKHSEADRSILGKSLEVKPGAVCSFRGKLVGVPCLQTTQVLSLAGTG